MHNKSFNLRSSFRWALVSKGEGGGGVAHTLNASLGYAPGVRRIRKPVCVKDYQSSVLNDD